MEISFSLERKGGVENASEIQKSPQFPGMSWKNQGEAKTKKQVTGVPEKEKVHEPLQVNHPPLSEREAFCTICHEETKGKKQRVKKARLYNLKSQCQKCGKILCRYHLRHYCVECLCKSSVHQVE